MKNFCENCGTQSIPKSSFCSQCGFNLNASNFQPNAAPIPDVPKQVLKVTSSPSLKWILVFVVAGILAFSNPNLDKHIYETNQVIKKVVNNNSSKDLLNNSNQNNQIFGGLGLLFGHNFVSDLSDKFISRQNFILFSLTVASFNGEESKIGLGVLGNVIIFSGFEKKLKSLYNQSKEPFEDVKIQNENNYNKDSLPNSNDDVITVDSTGSY